MESKFDELQQTIDLRRGDNGYEAAVAVVRSDKGKEYMDGIRVLIDAMKVEENRLLEKRNLQNVSSVAEANRLNLILSLLSIIAGLIAGTYLVLNTRRGFGSIREGFERIAEGRFDVPLSANIEETPRPFGIIVGREV